MGIFAAIGGMHVFSTGGEVTHEQWYQAEEFCAANAGVQHVHHNEIKCANGASINPREIVIE
jgi:hypothetical protein